MNQIPKAPKLNELVVNQSRALNSIWFAYLAIDPLSEDRMQILQAQAGYLPMGYGFYNVKVTQQPDGLWLSTWSCSHSCE